MSGPRWYLGTSRETLSLLSDRNGNVDEGERRELELLEMDGGARQVEVKRIRKVFAFTYSDLPMWALNTGDSGMGVEDLQALFDSVGTGDSLMLQVPREGRIDEYLVALTTEFKRTGLSLWPQRTEDCSFTLEQL